MSDEVTLTNVERLEALRAEKLAAKAKERDAQYEIDLEERIRLEDEHGTVEAVSVTRFVSGQPTMALLRTPSAPEYKRYKAHVYNNAQKKKGAMSLQEAQEQLARACWIYPTTEAARETMLVSFPGLLTPLGAAASSLAEGQTEEEGKG